MLRRFFAYYAPYRGLFALDFGCAVLAGLLELVFPVAVQIFIDDLLPRQDWTAISVAAAGLFTLYVLNAGLNVVVTYWGHMLGINIERDMRAEAFDHLQELSFSYYDNQKTGHLVGRLTKDLEEIGEIAHHGPEDLFIAVMTLLGALLLMFQSHTPLALITALIAPAVAWVTLHYGGRMTKTWRALYAQVGAFNARIEENVGGIRVVKAFANEPHERGMFARENAKYRETKLEAYKIMAASHSLSYLGMRFIQTIVMVSGAYFVIRGELSAGGFVAFLLLVNVFFRPLEKINAVIELYPKGIAGFKRFLELVNTKPEVVDTPGATEVEALRGNIRFDGVTFGYDPRRPVLRDVSLNIAAGETVAFVGPSGAGKTTLCALVPRFYDVQEGAVTIDGVDVRQVTQRSLRKQVGVVHQDVFLFAGTLRENIAYGRLDASEEEIMAAARKAELDALIRSLPEGLDTLIGERGVKLSGGQKQRLAIARMFLKNPPILILDEATSALDTQTERAIQASLTALSKGRTTLVIAHRLATIRNADRIVVVDYGGIAEVGSHEELLEQDGLYSELYRAQFSMDLPAASV